MSSQKRPKGFNKRNISLLSLLLLALLLALKFLLSSGSEQGGSSKISLPDIRHTASGFTTLNSASETDLTTWTAPDDTRGSPSAASEGGKTTAHADVTYGKAYSTKDQVALYLHLYSELPVNYITKSQAKALGWVPKEGNLWEVTDHKSIGGDRFSNREGTLPKKKGRQYFECDIDYKGGTRGPKRLVFSNDGLIFYTSDHYKNFKRLY